MISCGGGDDAFDDVVDRPLRALWLEVYDDDVEYGVNDIEIADLCDPPQMLC